MWRQLPLCNVPLLVLLCLPSLGIAHQQPPAPAAGMATATFVMVKREEWSISPPLHGGLLAHFSQYGAIDVHERAVSLGRGQPGQSGALWSKTPYPYSEWSVTARLSIRGGEEGGAGLAFWYTSEGHATGPVLGGPDKWRGLGLLLDTYDDDHRGNNPAILAIMNDGSFEYHPHSDGEGQYFAGCLRSLRNRPHPFSLRVSQLRQVLKVEIDDEGEGRNWAVCFEKQGIDLPAGSYFGISASTNEHPDEMELLELSVSSVKAESETPVVANNAQQPPQSHSSSSSTGLGSSVGAEELGKFVEAAIQRQFLDWQGDMGRRLHNVDEMIHSIRETINGMGKSINGLEEHVRQQLHHLETGPGHQELHHLLDEVRTRLETLQIEHGTLGGASMASTAGHGHQPNSSRWWIWFLALQAIMLLLFVLAKLRVDRRDKKLI